MHCTDERSASPHKIAIKSSSNRGRSASVVTVTSPVSAVKTPTCCNCFGPLKSNNRWDDAISNQMSEVYCRACEDDDDDQYVRIPKEHLNSPAILTNITNRRGQRSKSATKPKVQNSVFTIQNELEIPNAINATTQNNYASDADVVENSKNVIEDYELGDDAMLDDVNVDVKDTDSIGMPNDEANTRKSLTNQIDTNEMIRCRGKEELPELLVASNEKNAENETQPLCHSPMNRHKSQNYNESLDDITPSDNETNELIFKAKSLASKQMPNKIICTNDHPLIPKNIACDVAVNKVENHTKNTINNDCNGNESTAQTTTIPKKSTLVERMSILKGMQRMYSTLPRMKKVHTVQQDTAPNQPPYSIPMRTTPDGTTIYYLCDLSKNVIKGAD